jgi:hypothetical protein
MVVPGPELDAARAIVEQAAVEAGRDPAHIGMDGRVSWTGDADRLVDHVGRWRKAGASHLSVNTMNQGLTTVDQHVAAIERTAEALGLAPA